MTTRLVFAVLASLALTAFAPAPFPRRAPPAPKPIDRDALQGTWTVARWHVTNAKREPYQPATQLRIAKDKWEFLVHGKLFRAYCFEVEAGQSPVRLTLYYPGEREAGPCGIGLLRRSGRRLELVYRLGKASAGPPLAFDPWFADDHWVVRLVTLTRDE